MTMYARKTESRLVGGIALLGVRQAMNAVGSLGTAVVLVRYFGLGGYGQLSLVIGISGFFGILGGNFEETARRFLPECRETGDSAGALYVLKSILMVRAVTGVSASLLLFAVAGPLSQLYADANVGSGLFALASPLVFAAGLHAVAWSLFIGLQAYRLQAWLSVVHMLAGLSVASFAAWADLSMTQYLGSWMVVQLLTGAGALTLAVLGVRREFAVGGRVQQTRIGLSRLAGYALPLWGSWVSTVAYQHLGRSLLALFAPPTVIGAFSLAKAACDHLWTFLSQLPVAMLPALVRNSGSGAVDAPLERVTRLSRITAPLLAIALTILVAFGPEIFAAFDRVNAPLAAALFGLLAVQLPLRLTTSIWGTLYFIEERTHSVLHLNMIRLTLFTVAGAGLVPIMGADGSAAAEVIAFLGGIAFVALTVRRQRNMSPRVVLDHALSLSLYFGLWVLFVRVIDPSLAWRAGAAVTCIVGILILARNHMAMVRAALFGRRLGSAGAIAVR